MRVSFKEQIEDLYKPSKSAGLSGMAGSGDKYQSYCKPKLAELLDVIRLNQEFIKGDGPLLYTRDNKEVIDFIGGFGSTLLGHNPPDLIARQISLLQQSTPAMVQASIRGSAARLAEKLSKLASDKHEYRINFTNSGAESVEAAIKHCYKVHFDVMLKEYERLTRVLNDFYYEYEKLEHQPELPDGKDLIDFRDDLDEYNLAQFEAFQYKPVMVSLKGSFHGKTSASVKVTFNKSFREPFEGLSSVNTVFIDPEHLERLQEVADQEISTFYYPVLINNEVSLRSVSMTRVIGFIFEIVMGEGGIKPLSDHTLSCLTKIHDTTKIPFIIDEIQTGCGRLGAVYAYKTTPLAAIDPAYILLSKALGGGVVKIGATLIRDDVYDDDFGILHTSTFGEDEHSAEIASDFIDILQAGEGKLLKQCVEKGDYILKKLRLLADKYPAIIKDVRGRGLMIGMEFTALQNSSPFFRAAGKQGILSLLVASFLMHQYGLRVLAPISTILKGNPGKVRQSILRIQPPVCIEYSHIDLLVKALDHVCGIIANSNELILIAHLIAYDPSIAELNHPDFFHGKWPLDNQDLPIDARVGFVVHPTSLETLIEYYFPSFHAYEVDHNKFEQWWNKLSRFLEPVHVINEYVSSSDFCIQVAMVFVPYLPDYMTRKNNKTISKEIKDKIQDAVTIARELGDDNIPVSIVGLGAFTSILTDNGETINHYEVPVTTGNAYTVALSIQGVFQAAEMKQLDMRHASVAVLGATGNIGSVIAELLAPHVGSLYLLGSNKGDSLRRLQLIQRWCLKTVKDILQQDRMSEDEIGNIAMNMSALDAGQSADETGIYVSNGSQVISEVDIVIIATNSSGVLIRPEEVKEDAIVCCTSVPSNLSRDFKNHPSIIAFEGGLAQLPDDSCVNFVGMPKDGLVYGCLAETLVLGFDGQNHSFSKGPITAQQVFDIVEKAQIHGFDLGELKLPDSLSVN